MSGTGPTPAEQHLGDRLAALVDGELKHDARERVLAHLATCSRCKAEADAQRRLKSAFATAAPPSPSEGFLARLQGLPGGTGGSDDDRGDPFAGGRRFGDGVFPVLQHPGGRAELGAGSSPLKGLGYLPTAHASTAVLPGGPPDSVFRVHGVGREADRSPWRARRFAFAAAGAVSLAAIALGGTLPLDYGPEAPLSAEGAGTSVTPLDADARTGRAGAVASRSGGGSLSAGGGPGASSPPTGPVLAAAPSLLSTTALTGHTLAFPVLNVSVPPLIRPTDAGPLFTAALGGGADPRPAVPSATASASQAPRDRVIPLSPLR
ncbi:anti-sigma factor [Streptomyces sp. B1I3]|uniref:anti-sigma factor family protein n=1 Tax=Streptomyces sp. B1I3 TaxID=3042264 RepID=UPI002783198B|nr:anti-sigma factor [Streptomyces sp. B1I3]MDQ0794151.1 anti-sigma factor RsiW [Streptomyces sp. B1I3]